MLTGRNERSMGLFDRREPQNMYMDSDSIAEELKRSSAHHTRDILFCLLIIILVIVFKDALGIGRGITIDSSEIETQVGVIDAAGNVHTVVYSDIRSITLRSDLKEFKQGEMISGEETWNIRSGTFRNSEFGEYELHVMHRLHNFIVVETDEGILAFNLESDKTTKSLYEYILEKRQGS